MKLIKISALTISIILSPNLMFGGSNKVNNTKDLIAQGLLEQVNFSNSINKMTNLDGLQAWKQYGEPAHKKFMDKMNFAQNTKDGYFKLHKDLANVNCNIKENAINGLITFFQLQRTTILIPEQNKNAKQYTVSFLQGNFEQAYKVQKEGLWQDARMKETQIAEVAVFKYYLDSKQFKVNDDIKFDNYIKKNAFADYLQQHIFTQEDVKKNKILGYIQNQDLTKKDANIGTSSNSKN